MPKWICCVIDDQIILLRFVSQETKSILIIHIHTRIIQTTCKLREMLPEDRWDTLAKYQDAAAELHSMELEAAFQAAFSLARELP